MTWKFWLRALLSAALVLILSATPPLRASEPPRATQAAAAFAEGLAAYRAGAPLTAIDHWQRALALADDPQAQAQSWGNLAIAYYETGQYPSALAANQAALDIFQAEGQTAAMGQVQSNLGNVYEALGRYDRAVELYQRSAEIARQQGDQRAVGVSLGNLGYLHSIRGDQAAALAAHRESLAIATATGDREGQGHRLLNLGIAHHAQDDIAAAEDFYQQSLAIAQALGHRPLEAKALGNLAMAAADTGRYAAAIDQYEQSLEIARTLHSPSLAANILNNLGHTLLAARQLEAAEARLRESIAWLDALQTELPDDARVSLFDTQIYTYNLLTQILVAQNRPEAALETAEAGRARAMAQLLSRGSAVAAPAAPTLADIRATARQLNATLVEYALVPEESFRVLGRQRGRTEALHIWVVSPDGRIQFRQQPIDLSATSLEGLVRRARRALTGSVRRGRPSPPSLEELYALLIQPVADLLPADPEAQVVIIPQEALFLVPFPALRSDSGRYLIEDHTLLSAPSIQVLGLAQERQAAPAAPAELLVVGNPEMPEVWSPRAEKNVQLSELPWSEQEAVAIATLFNTQALTAKAASEQVVKQRIRNAQIVHLATHGLLEYGQPAATGTLDMPGAIALAPGDGQDGLLTAAEILDELQLKANLVVLSACDTGRGEITGDGVIGLSRALIGAGASGVVVSLWAVPDASTAQLMVAFYRHLHQAQTPAAALRQSMLDTLAARPNPRDWAAFTLIGVGGVQPLP